VERDAEAPACWGRFPEWPASGVRAAKAPAAPRGELGLPEKRSAAAGADRKESDLAWGPAERAGPESEYRVAQPAGQTVVRQPGAAAAAPIEQVQMEQPPREPHAALPAEPRQLVRAW
jgi:hypothetical protein